MAVIAKRSIMTFFSSPTCPYCHMVRFVLTEKGLAAEIYDVDVDNLPDDLLEINPYATVPTLVDRDLVLYESRVIMEYLDERFPHPPLLPVDPVSKARSRLLMHRVAQDWYSLLPDIKSENQKKADKARKALRDSLISAAPVFELKSYFMSDEFTLIDCLIAPLFWRLGKLGIELPEEAQPVKDYMNRVFNREAFKASLSELELDMC
ncbi:MAG: stringent starvation protein A [Methylococcales bacterium]|jgi:RNA polymerase-associated protein|nr:stringent starvation protein A [Methylococcales bacterium]MBT7408449.1 stringent starvation protein A [Methylococcales bacterium]